MLASAYLFSSHYIRITILAELVLGATIAARRADSALMIQVNFRSAGKLAKSHTKYVKVRLKTLFAWNDFSTQEIKLKLRVGLKQNSFKCRIEGC